MQDSGTQESESGYHKLIKYAVISIDYQKKTWIMLYSCSNKAINCLPNLFVTNICKTDPQYKHYDMF